MSAVSPRGRVDCSGLPHNSQMIVPKPSVPIAPSNRSRFIAHLPGKLFHPEKHESRQTRRRIGFALAQLCHEWPIPTSSAKKRPQPLGGKMLGLALSGCTTRNQTSPWAPIPSLRARRPRLDHTLNSSIRRPDANCFASQRGHLPRPAQVSAGSSGFRYLGGTRGYGLRAAETGCSRRFILSANRRFC